MKIIAQTGRDSWLISASSYELGKIQGCYNDAKAEIGKEIPVTDLYETTGALMTGSNELLAFRSSMEKLLLACEKLSGAIAPAVDNVKNKKDK